MSNITINRNLKVLISKEKIADRVVSMADEIATDLVDKTLVMVGLLTGSVVFMADLMRALSECGLDPEVDFMIVESYGEKEVSSGEIKIVQDVRADLSGKTVLLVDDIIDTGLTFSRVKSLLAQKNPARIVSVALLDKPSGRKVDYTPDYVGFSVENHFVIGYGLDSGGMYRSLPYFGYLDD